MLFQRFFFLGLMALFFSLVRGSPVSTSIEDSSAFPSLMEFERRQSSDTGSSSKGFYWPRIDGPLEEAIGLLNVTPPVLTVGYWYYTTVFDKVFMEIGQKNQSQALQFLYNQMVKNQQLFYDTCVETTNATANAAQRTNTVARVVCFPNGDPNIAIDKLQLANPVDFGCWERDVNGNPNVPLFDSTLTVLQKLQWDRQSAIVKIQQIIKDLGVNDPQLTS